MKRFFLTASLLLCCSSNAKEYAATVRPTELKSEPYSDAQTLTKLPESAKVEVLERQISWMQIRANSLTGWVKMLSLRFEHSALPQKSEVSSLQALFNLVTTGSTASVVTTGVRGIDESKLQNPSPNPQALKNMQLYAISESEARQFAAQAHLQAQVQAYLDTGVNK